MSRLRVTFVVEIVETLDNYSDFKHATNVENTINTRLDALSGEIASQYSGRFDEVEIKRRVTK